MAALTDSAFDTFRGPLDLNALSSEQLQQLYMQKKKFEEAQKEQDKENSLVRWKNQETTSEEWDLKGATGDQSFVLFVNKQQCNLPYSLSFTSTRRSEQRPNEVFTMTLTISEEKEGLKAVLTQSTQRKVRYDDQSLLWREDILYPTPTIQLPQQQQPQSSAPNHPSVYNAPIARTVPTTSHPAVSFFQPNQAQANGRRVMIASPQAPQATMVQKTQQQQPQQYSPQQSSYSPTSQMTDGESRMVDLRKEYELTFPFMLNGKLFEQLKATVYLF